MDPQVYQWMAAVGFTAATAVQFKWRGQSRQQLIGQLLFIGFMFALLSRGTPGGALGYGFTIASGVLFTNWVPHPVVKSIVGVLVAIVWVLLFGSWLGIAAQIWLTGSVL